MSSSLKYLLLVAPAALMIAILFLYPLGFSLVSAFTAPGQPFTLDHFRKVYALYASDVLFSLLIVLISVALLALIAITLSAVIALSPCRPVVRLLGFLYRLPLFIPFIVVAQMMRTFLAKNGLMNNALVAADLVTPLETLSWLGWKGIVITFVWKQLAFATLLICGRWRRWSRRRSLLHVTLAPPGRGSCSISCCRRSCRPSAWRWCCRR
jgi:ABC-type spermidine/putrescine transport system permease subunit I